VDAKYEFNKCIELRALSRQSRDLIALLIKCFSAQTYFINSKIIANVQDDDGNIDEATAVAPSFSVSEVLMELEFIKRELYNQINLSKNLEKEKHSLCN
jgi:copper oxidase (laccase) domain-containing protein